MDSLAPSLLETVERETAPSPTWSVIWLHGLGADGHDFEPIVPELLRPGWPAIRFVFPPTQVAPYVEGTRTVEIPARALLPHIVPAYRTLFQGG